jgi:hypothetical protein
MDAIEKTKQLKLELEKARATAIELRDELQNAEHLDVTYIDLALETASMRLVYLQRQAEATKNAEAEKSRKKKKETE